MTQPNFLVIGAAKCGTSSLYHLLRQHPMLFLPDVKEPRFFAMPDGIPPYVGPGDLHGVSDAVVDREEYLALFAQSGNAVASGEVSPIYLFEPGTARRIHAFSPTMRIIAILRDPSERAFSSWLHLIRLNRETENPFARALEAEARRHGEPRDLLWHYVQGGFYHRQLSEYFTLFPSSQLKIVLTEDLEHHSAETMASLFEFLGVDSTVPISLEQRHNVGSVPRKNLLRDWIARAGASESVFKRMIPKPVRRALVERVSRLNRHRPGLDPEDRARLIATFRSDILQLQDLIQRDLTAWLRV